MSWADGTRAADRLIADLAAAKLHGLHLVVGCHEWPCCTHMTMPCNKGVLMKLTR